jgi:hypothetical protein
MKDITLAVITHLKANTTLAGYTGISPNQRIYRASLPQVPTHPCIVVWPIDTKRLNISHSGNRIGQSRIQCTVYATTDVSGNQISEIVADDLHGLNNAHLGVGVQVIRVDDAGVRIDANPNIGKYLYHRDFLIQHYY